MGSINIIRYLSFVFFYNLMVNFPASAHNDLIHRNKNKANLDSIPFKIISKGGNAGAYQAFPDALRLSNGHILVAFYSGDGHVTKANANYPKAGRICFVRSKDEGKTWSTPRILYDDVEDNRDAHLTQLNDGTIICTFFNLRIDTAKHGEVRIVASKDNGQTWNQTSQLVAKGWFCSAKVKELSDGALLLPVYTIINNKTNSTRIGFTRSNDKGQSWDPVLRAGLESDFTVNETEVITLRDGTLYAATRGNFKEQIHMQFSTSKDLGKSWSTLSDIGFYGDAPSFTRLQSDEILLSVRGYLTKEKTGPSYTCLRISSDECKTWQGPYLVDKSSGAYPSTIELKDKTILIIFYQEGAGSGIGAIRFKMPASIKGEQFAEPKELERLPL
ncbi:MAG: hypothetical protein JWR72_3500 [Flavisolibacter sp.]|nr:hypothetical protein [Flavisolibacter sp.]